MKARERREFPGGMGGSHFRVRVTECEALAEGAERVSDDAPAHDWTPEREAPQCAPYVEPAK